MVKLDPVSSEQTILYPTEGHYSEFEVQAFLYHALKKNGFEVRGEIKARLKNTRQTCRFDLVIFRGDHPLLIIEIKRRARKHKKGLESTRQAQRYRRFGVPCYFVYGLDDSKQLLELLCCGGEIT